jgi:LEA14-like dessication related protein
MERRHFLFLTAGVATTVLTACTGTLQEPLQVRVSNVVPLQATLFEQRFLISLRIGNPNDSDLELTGLTVSLELNGHDFLEGLSNQHVTVPRLGYADMEVEGSTTLLGLVRQVWALEGRDAIDYSLSGRAYVEGAPFGSVSYNREGRLRFAPRRPEDAPGTLRTLQAL